MSDPMKLQLWTTADGEPNEMLGQVEVDDEEWHNAQAEGGDALELIQALASEVGNE